MAEGDRLSVLDWTARHRSLLSPDRALDFGRHLYLRGLYECEAEKIVVMKGSQMGVSEYLISYGMHGADQRDATVLYIFPTDTHVSDFSTGRIGPAIEASPYLTSIVVDAAGSQQRGADRVTLKRIRNRFLYLRGAKIAPDGRAPQLESIDADILIFDEFDEMDARAPHKARKRLDHSALAEERLASIPTYAGRGVHAEFLQSDQRHWHVRCEHCGKRQVLTIDHIVTGRDELDRPVRWHGYPDRAWAACASCGKKLDHLAAGEWIAAEPGKSIAGFHVPKLFSPAVTLLDVVKRLLNIDESARRETITHDLALPYTPRGGALTGDLLDACRREYELQPSQADACVMGIDVGSLLHVVIRGQPDAETGERPQRFVGQIGAWDELDRLMNLYQVKVAVIDGMPETTKAREFQARHPPGHVWLAYYVAQKSSTRAVEPWAWDALKGVVDLDRTRTLDEMYAGLLTGKLTLPARARDIPDYYAHLKASVRVIDGGVARYVESGPDHYCHAENYCTVASHAPPALSQGQPTQFAQAVVTDGRGMFS